MNEDIENILNNVEEIKEMAGFGDPYCEEALHLLSQMSQIIKDSVSRGIKGSGYSREMHSFADQLKIRVIYEPK